MVRLQKFQFSWTNYYYCSKYSGMFGHFVAVIILVECNKNGDFERRTHKMLCLFHRTLCIVVCLFFSFAFIFCFFGFYVVYIRSTNFYFKFYLLVDFIPRQPEEMAHQSIRICAYHNRWMRRMSKKKCHHLRIMINIMKQTNPESHELLQWLWL